MATHTNPRRPVPFDRFIIATALRLHVPIVTTDEKFAAYGVEVLA